MEQKGTVSAPHVTWDEETIAAHDLLRGTRQKIEEPNTPYHYYGPDREDDDAGELGAVSPARSASGREHEPKLEWGELQTKLQRVQDTKQQRHASEWDSSNDEGNVGSKRSHFADRDEEGKKIVKDPKFADKRKSHYNEFERMKAWRQTHANDDDDDEDEEKEGAAMHD